MLEPATARTERRRSRCTPLGVGVAILTVALAASPAGSADCDGYAGGDAAAAFWGVVSKDELRACIVALGVGVKNEGDGSTPLHWASGYSARREPVVALVQAGADLEARDNAGWTPLHWAIASVEASTIVSFLLDAGADPNARDNRGWTPVHVETMFPHDSPDILTTLLEAGGDPRARTYLDELSPLHLVVGSTDNASFLDVLLDFGAYPDAREFYGWTPLHVAVKSTDNPAIVMALIEGGADPMARVGDDSS